MVLKVPTVKTTDQVRDQLEFLQSKLDCCLVIDGESLQVRCVFAILGTGLIRWRLSSV